MQSWWIRHWFRLNYMFFSATERHLIDHSAFCLSHFIQMYFVAKIKWLWTLPPLWPGLIASDCVSFCVILQYNWSIIGEADIPLIPAVVRWNMRNTFQQFNSFRSQFPVKENLSYLMLLHFIQISCKLPIGSKIGPKLKHLFWQFITYLSHKRVHEENHR